MRRPMKLRHHVIYSAVDNSVLYKIRLTSNYTGFHLKNMQGKLCRGLEGRKKLLHMFCNLPKYLIFDSRVRVETIQVPRIRASSHFMAVRSYINSLLGCRKGVLKCWSDCRVQTSSRKITCALACITSARQNYVKHGTFRRGR